MKHLAYILAFAFILAATASCDKDEPAAPTTPATENQDKSGATDTSVPEGYFVARFATDTRAAVNEMNTRIQHLRYIIFKQADGTFVKEQTIAINRGGQQWPMGVITDTLPLGSYKVVFLGNADNSLFTYDGAGEFDVLTGYTEGYSAARISLPPIEFTDNTEYYMAQAEFSNITPASVILLQRIVTNLELKRVFVDAETALDSLYENILHIYDTDVTGLLDNVLGGVLRTALQAETLNPLSSLFLASSTEIEGIVDGIL